MDASKDRLDTANMDVALHLARTITAAPVGLFDPQTVLLAEAIKVAVVREKRTLDVVDILCSGLSLKEGQYVMNPDALTTALGMLASSVEAELPEYIEES